MARIGGFKQGKRREELLANYAGEEPYMPGGYETPYDGEEPYLPEDYDDAPYDDEGYDEGDYDDGGYWEDDGYDVPYEGSRYDDDYGYDEAYGEGDWPEDGYDDRAPYYDAPEYVPERSYPAGGAGALLRYVDENEWVTWLLLLLLPPLGILLLWRRGRFNSASGVVLGVLGTLWFIALMVLLVLRPFRPASDTTITPQPVGAAMLTAKHDEAQEAVAQAAAVVTAEEVDEANAVYVVANTPYYHQVEGCQAIAAGSEVSRISRNRAIEDSLLACPYCMAGQYSDGMWDLVFVNADLDDRSNMQVYCSPYNTHFHTDATCSDIGGDARQVGLKEALLMAKTACDVCCPDAAQEVYCTLDGNYYHAEQYCSGMRNASRVTYAEARVTGKKRCPVCIGGEDARETDAATTASGYYVYATAKGNFYHVNATCSGMRDAKQVLLSDMIKKGRPPCPVCCPDAETTVFAEDGNPYYHSYATCSGMTQATQGILVNALAAGLTRCPVCWTSASGS